MVSLVTNGYVMCSLVACRLMLTIPPPAQVYNMLNFNEDIDTRITFHQLNNDGTQIECNVHTKKGKLFFDNTGELFEADLLPTIYLVDNRSTVI